MRGTLAVALKAHLHPRHQHCTDEAQKAETVLSAVGYVYICLEFFLYLLIIFYMCCLNVIIIHL